MALRCLIAARNSESRSGCSQFDPTAARSVRSRTMLLTIVRSRRRVDARAMLELVQQSQMALELLEHVAAHIAAGQDRQDVEQTADRGASPPGTVLLAVIDRLRVQEVQAQEGAHALVERLLEDRGLRRRCSACGGLSHRSLLCLTRSPCVNGFDAVTHSGDAVAAIEGRTAIGASGAVLDFAVARRDSRQCTVVLIERRDLRRDCLERPFVVDNVVARPPIELGG